MPMTIPNNLETSEFWDNRRKAVMEVFGTPLHRIAFPILSREAAIAAQKLADAIDLEPYKLMDL